MIDSYGLMELLKAKIDELPAGYISKKTIKGKIQYYRQWREDGKLKSKYVPESEVEQIRSQLEERKRLQQRLKELQKKFPERKKQV